jgi:hypothetical protein
MSEAETGDSNPRTSVPERSGAVQKPVFTGAGVPDRPQAISREGSRDGSRGRARATLVRRRARPFSHLAFDTSNMFESHRWTQRQRWPKPHPGEARRDTPPETGWSSLPSGIRVRQMSHPQRRRLRNNPQRWEIQHPQRMVLRQMSHPPARADPARPRARPDRAGVPRLRRCRGADPHRPSVRPEPVATTSERMTGSCDACGRWPVVARHESPPRDVVMPRQDS